MATSEMTARNGWRCFNDAWKPDRALVGRETASDAARVVLADDERQ